MNAAPTQEENDRIINKLLQIKKEIEDGSSIRMKAIINSDDPGVTQNGGRYTITKNSPFIKEFKETAFSLDIGQVSEPIKSMFGYHIIQLHEIRGDQRVASHILMQPDIPQETLSATKEKAEQIKQDILKGKLTFEEAVQKYSDDKDTKNNDGLLVNEYTGESNFDLTRMDPALYARVSDLKKGEMTDVFYDEKRGGEKMYKLIIMKERTDTHIADLVDDYVKVQSLALQKKKEEAIAKWSKNKIGDTYIKISEDFLKCSFEKLEKRNPKLMSDAVAVDHLASKFQELKSEIGKVIIGQENAIDYVLLSVFCGGHSLLIGVPGLAKTLLVHTVSDALGLHFKRIQFTPDLMPSDILGSEILDKNREFTFIKGPIFPI